MEKYEIVGNIVPYVELTLNEGEEVYTQSGGMSWRDTTFEMSTSTKGGNLKNKIKFILVKSLKKGRLPLTPS